MAYIIDLKEVSKESIPVVGGKNAGLGEMIRAGIRVPNGFAVTTDSFLSFIQETGLQDRIFETLSGLDPNDVASVNEAAERVQGMIKEAPISSDITGSIEKAYIRLCEEYGLEAVPVAVRSSATAEDLPSASFAGQQETFLWVLGREKVIESVHKCWASLFTPRAVSYRIKNDFPHEKVLISVGVQKMVNSRAAGVMFTLNPTDGDPSKVLIEGSWGLGETVVSGSVNPDKFVIDKVVMELTERTISTKHIECIFDSERGEVIDAEVESDLQCTCCLEEQEVRELVRIAKEIEAHYGRHMDIEWAIDKDMDFPENMFIVQARPETVWSQKKSEPILGKKTGYQLLMEQAMKRIKIP